mgnify:CR=1 FL=1
MCSSDLPFSGGWIAATKGGTVIGPEGSGDERDAEVAYEVDTTDNSVGSDITGPVYEMAAPSVATNPIPRSNSSIVSVESICVEATGSTGNEEFEVRIVDDDWPWSDNILARINVTIARPDGCFSGALIGSTTATATLTNPSGTIDGPAGSSNETTAEVGYEIGPSYDNSPTVNVTAQ